MRSINYVLCFTYVLFITLSCSVKENPKPNNGDKISHFSRKNEFPYDYKLTYDNSGNLETITSLDYIIKITYANNQINSLNLQSVTNGFTSDIKVNHISERELFITSSDDNFLQRIDLKFNENGFLEKSVRASVDWDTLTYQYKYNDSDNLILVESSYPWRILDTITYSDYDDKTNPYFSLHKTWSIINSIFRLDNILKLPFPIGKNNPRIITLDEYRGGSKLQYNYNEKGLPTEITEYFYKGARKGPPIDSDYWLVEGNVKMEY